MAYWDFPQARQSYFQNRDEIDQINLFLYALNPEGSIYRHAVRGLNEVTAAAAELRQQVFLTIVNDVIGTKDEKVRLKDGRIVHDIISQKETRERHIQELIDLVGSTGASGIDIDYESLDPEDKDAFTAFLRELATGLHAKNKLLAVTLEPKTKDVNYKGPGAADWKEIGRIADEVRIMCYNYSYINSEPGPVAPVYWIEDVLRFALENIPREKIVVGLPFFGIDWVKKGEAAGISTRDVFIRLNKERLGFQIDGLSHSKWFKYSDEKGRERTVWFEDIETIGAKIERVRGLGIHRFIFWRIGAESRPLKRLEGRDRVNRNCLQ
jgi:spore germination protein YaaH